MAFTRIKNLQGTPAEWTTANPILLSAEAGYEKQTDGTFKVKIGDGTTAWNSLPYSIDYPAMAAVLASEAERVASFESMAGATLGTIVQTIEEDYPTELAAVNTQLADTTQLYQSTIDTILAGDVENANTAQLILAAGTDANLPARLTRHESRTSALESVVIGLSDISSWEDVQRLVQQGLGPKAFPAGTQLKTQHTEYGEILWDVVAHDNHKKPGDDNAHTMMLQMYRCIYGRAVSSIQALYAVNADTWPTGMPAGVYNFTLMAGYDVAAGGGKTFQFTLTNLVPVGGVIMFPWGAQAIDTKVSTFASTSATVPIENNVPVVEGTGGTNLGTTDGLTPHVNHAHRLRYGNNHIGESALRQWMNSSAVANAWWQPKTEFDRPPNYANVAGFMAGLPADFLAVVGAVDVTTAYNTIFNTNGIKTGSYVTRDKFFLPSMTELGFGANNSVMEGSLMSFYEGVADIDRIKYDIASPSTPRLLWLRSPNPSNAYSVRIVNTSGALSNNYANNGNGAAAACVIY